MQIKIFSLHAFASAVQEEEINKFLRSHRVLTIDRHFSSENGGYWTLLVSYQEDGGHETPAPVFRSAKKDYREVLDDDQFVVFTRMKDIRRTIARQESIPAYAVFTDEELANIAKMPEICMESLKTMKGVGKRAEKYGKFFLNSKRLESDETGGESAMQDS